MKEPTVTANDKESIIDCINVYFGNKAQENQSWLVKETVDRRFGWVEVVNTAVAPREQGWKIHVSATIHSVLDVLRAIAPTLKAYCASFKVCRNFTDVRFLNSGDAGLSQIGKVITVYPNNDEQMVELAFQLNKLTAGLSGPRIRYDRPLSPGSLVHYRFGSFGQLTYQDITGEIKLAIKTPDGDLTEDDRLNLNPPPWAIDPFNEAGYYLPEDPQNLVLSGRYLCLGQIYRSAKGCVLLAEDMETDDSRQVVIKQAHRNIFPDGGKVDSISMLRNEMGILSRLQGYHCIPKIFDDFEQNGDYFIVLECIEGIDLRQYVSTRSYSGCYFSEQDIVNWGLHICAIVHLLHSNNIIHRDLKPGNFILTDENAIKLLDFELAFDSLLANSNFAVMGTRGYYSPQQMSGASPSISDDVFGLGALLYYLATNCDPSLAAREWGYDDRWIDEINSDVQPALQMIIKKCLEFDPNLRYSSVEDVARDLSSIPLSSDKPRQICNTITTQHPPYITLALNIGAYACSIAREDPAGMKWISEHKYSYGVAPRDINVGASGIGLFLIDLYTVTNENAFKDTALKACDWLLSAHHRAGNFLPGLYVGESGVGMFTLLVGITLQSDYHIQHSIKIADQVYEYLPSSPDLFNGLAGCGMYLLILSEVTGNDAILGKAVDIGERLIKMAESHDDECSWVIPSGYGSLSHSKCIGFAHGAAGIGYFLIELFEATGHEKFREVAVKTATFILRNGKPVLNDGTGTNWPDTVGGDIQSLFWCHGAAGVVRFFTRLYEICRDSAYLDAAKKAGLLVANGGRWLNPTQCHGLSGNIECLLDLYWATNDHIWQSQARHLAKIMIAQSVEQNGFIVWPSEEPTIITPDFMVGYSGVGECLLRLHSVSHRPHIISRQYFKQALGVL